MKDLKTVFSFYLYKELRSKGFLIVTILLSILSIGSMLFMKFYFKEPDKTTLYVIDQTKELSTVWEDELFKEDSIGNVRLDFSMKDNEQTIEELTTMASEENKSFAYFSGENGMFTMNVIDEGKISYTDISLLQSLIVQVIQANNVKDLEISEDVLIRINPEIVLEITDPSEEPDNFATVFVLFLIMVMFVILYANSSSTEVSYLKTNRVMEIFSTSVKPLPLYLGVNLATSLVPFIQLLIAGICLFITKNILNVNFEELSSSAGIDLSALEPKGLIIYIVFFLLGFYIYSFINTALVSIISKAEDLATIAVPIAFIGMIQYFIGMTIMEKDNVLAAICSYIPLTSSSVMFMRYMFGYVGIGQVIISILILLLSVSFLAYVGANLFKRGVSYYGNLKEFKFKKRN